MVSFGTSRFHFFHAIVCLGMILAARPLEAAGISVKFDRHAPAATPMPSNLFTVPAPEHTTGREVRLPLPDCAAHPSDCTLVAALNTLDGFNLQPRLSIPFTGSIDPHTATEETVFLLRLSDPRGHSVSTSPQHVEKIALNQLVWDATSQTLHAESDEFLQQNTHYALIVTRSVRDGFGRKLSRRGFLRFLKRLYSTPDGWPYLYELSSAVVAARAAGISFTDLAGVSVFTTQTTTTALE
ncbi:MAG: hypothetical protein MPN21_01510, partial [Thermoanaerobaculia bacterium]|nr:hypothetical protein [Thermoanaerobaculia bacterium]